MDPITLAMLGSSIGGGLSSLFSSSPASAANKYLNKIPGMMKGYYDPYIQAGQRQLPGLEGQYGQMMNDPGQFINNIGKGYQKSPGFDFALQQALQGAGNAAAAGGMAGSPQHEQQNMGLATNLANQDYNQWLQNALGQHQQGLEGSQGLYNTGSNMSGDLAQSLANLGLTQAGLGFQNQRQQNSSIGDIFGGLGGLFGLGKQNKWF
jgi:hypothetical protein